MGAVSNRVPWKQKQIPGRNPYSVILRWSKEVNKLVVKCCTKVIPAKRVSKKNGDYLG